MRAALHRPVALALLALSACDDADRPREDRSPDPDGPVGDSVETVPGDTAADTGPAVEPDPPDVVVDCAGGGDFVTIAEAMAASTSGTRIGLRPCTYVEDLDFAGKSLDVFGIEGSAVTILQGTGGGPVVTATRGESVGTRLAGVTVTGGAAADGYGSALRVDAAVLELDDVVVQGNERGYAVMYATGAHLDLVDVAFRDNRVMRGGMVVLLDNGSMVAERLEIVCDDDRIEYGLYEHNSTLLLDSRVACGTAAAILVTGGELQARRTEARGGAYGLYAGDNEDDPNERLWLHNSAFAGDEAGALAYYMYVKARNVVFHGGRVGLDLYGARADSWVESSAAVGTACGFRTDGVAPAWAWNAVDGTGASCRAQGAATIEGDPRFVDTSVDFALAADSPLVDAGDPDPDRDDADGTRNDVGRYGGPDALGPP